MDVASEATHVESEEESNDISSTIREEARRLRDGAVSKAKEAPPWVWVAVGGAILATVALLIFGVTRKGRN